jgi:hypothetical protein
VDRGNPFDSEETRIGPFEIPQKGYHPSDGSVDLSESILSSAYEKVARSSPTPGISKSFNELMKMKDAITSLNLSCNNLLDVDLPIIANFVTQCPNCSIVDVSLNRFYGNDEKRRLIVDEARGTLLRQPAIKVVDICFNPVASVDRADLFHRLSREALAKLIWVPKIWLSAGRWKDMLPEANVELVEETHNKFYY